MDRCSFLNIYNVCFDLISFIIKIPKIGKNRECPSVRTVVSIHVPVFEHSETQYPHGYKSLRSSVWILGDPVSAQRPCYLPSAKNFYKHYICVIYYYIIYKKFLLIKFFAILHIFYYNTTEIIRKRNIFS